MTLHAALVLSVDDFSDNKGIRYLLSSATIVESHLNLQDTRTCEFKYSENLINFHIVLKLKYLQSHIS